MALPTSLPFAVQANWDDTETWSPWDQAHANILCQDADGAPTLRSLDITRNLVRTAVGPETCRLVVVDRDYNLRPLRASSVLSPNMALHRRVRVLRQVTTGVWQAIFFGYITSIKPQPLELSPPLCEITLESPLAVLGRRTVTVPSLFRPPVYQATEPVLTVSALSALLTAADLTARNLVLEDVGNLFVPGTWGGVVNFGQALAALARYAGAVAYVEPYFAEAADDPNWQLHWSRPTDATALSVHWDWRDGELNRTPAPEIVYADAMAAA